MAVGEHIRLQEVEVQALDAARLETLIGPERIARYEAIAEATETLLGRANGPQHQFHRGEIDASVGQVTCGQVLIRRVRLDERESPSARVVPTIAVAMISASRENGSLGTTRLCPDSAQSGCASRPAAT